MAAHGGKLQRSRYYDRVPPCRSRTTDFVDSHPAVRSEKESSSKKRSWEEHACVKEALTPGIPPIFVMPPVSPHGRLAELEAECAALRRENAELRQRLGLVDQPAQKNPPARVGVLTSHSPAAEKVTLFRKLFRGREDIFAVLWIGKDGKAGYSPAALKDWSNLDASGRPARQFLPLTDEAVTAHLTGRQTIGVYPLLADESCWFLAADFDKDGWQTDAHAFLRVCHEQGIAAALERSRSGRGGHVWIFFAEPLPAHLARKLGAAILTRAMDRRHELGLDSYDRFFPNQDTMPKGGLAISSLSRCNTRSPRPRLHRRRRPRPRAHV
jgi:hypothetical protein